MSRDLGAGAEGERVVGLSPVSVTALGVVLSNCPPLPNEKNIPHCGEHRDNARDLACVRRGLNVTN